MFTRKFHRLAFWGTTLELVVFLHRMQKNLICLEYENTLFFTWGWKSGCPRGVFCPSPSPTNTYSYVGQENSDSTRKFVRNYLNWRAKYLNTSTTIRKILVPKKMLSSVRKYIKPKPISRRNQKLTQQHHWKKSSSSPREAWAGSSSPREASVSVPALIFFWARTEDDGKTWNQTLR